MRKSNLALLLTLLLVSCFGSNDAPEAPQITVSGAISGIMSAELIGSAPIGGIPRPSSNLGIYVAAFLAQGVFLPSQTAALGIEAARRIAAGQETPTTDETFELLQQLGDLLQVDVMDILNRSVDRATTLDQYVESLSAVRALSVRKFEELQAAAEALRDTEREQRRAVRDIERSINQAFDDEDFGTAGSQQQDLVDAETELAETITKRQQAEDLADRFEQLLEISAERLVAIEANRAILIAGLKVIELPGIEDLGILMEGDPNAQSDSLGAGQLRN